MRCETCGQDLPPLAEDPVIDLTSDDEAIEEARENDFFIEKQCDCMHNVDVESASGDRCQNIALSGNGGLCTPCLFGCVP